jgi:hypothetical protein
MRLFFLTVAAGKGLIARGIARHPRVGRVLESGTLVIVAGTTNAFVAKEVLASLGEDAADFPFHWFFRGVALPPGISPEAGEFPGDVVISKGIWRRGATIFDVVDDLGERDLIVKGANALNLPGRQVGVLVGHEKAGTMGVIAQAVVGRRVELLIPVGLEKRIYEDILTLSSRLNRSGFSGPKLFPAPGKVFTEIEAIRILTGAETELVAAGGAFGAEGGVWLGVEGDEDQLKDVASLVREVSK